MFEAEAIPRSRLAHGRLAEAARRLGVFAAPEDALTRRIRAQQIDLLFNNVAPGVIGASLVNLCLAFLLVRLDAVGLHKGLVWGGYIFACMAAHLALLYRYKTSPFDASRWRLWATLFTLIAFIEGLGWGWAPVWLITGSHTDLRLLVTFATMIVGCAAVPAFGFYLPAFFALAVPACAPIAVASVFDPDPVFGIVAFMMPVYLITVPALAVQTSRKFKELVSLRLKSAEFAEHLRSQIELVEQAMVAKSNFLAAASHDLRQPVHAIGLFAGALSKLVPPGPAQRLTDQIQNSVSALDGLFAAVLDISRLDERSVEVRRGDFVVGPLIARIVQDFSAEAAAKSVEVRCSPCSVRVHTDPLLLERILRNLVSNAVRYTPTGRVLVGCRRRRAGLDIQVWDTGLGIAPEHHDSIFKEYFQLHNSERDRQKGLGLGLAIVQRLAALIACRLTLRSQLGRGSGFSLSVPLAERDAAVPSPAVARLPIGRETGLIVIVDDEAPILLGLTALLESWGYAVVAGAAGDEVLAKLGPHQFRPDLIISDYWLRAGETGFDVIDAIRLEFNAEIPAIIVSGDTGPELRAKTQAADVTLMHKPTPNGRLRAGVANLLAAGRRNISAAADQLTP